MSSNDTVIVTGDDVQIAVQLKKGGVTVDLTGASIEANIRREGVLAAGPVSLDSGATGADWSTSLVVVEFTSAETAAISLSGLSDHAAIEIQVDAPSVGGKKTWLVYGVVLKLGLIA